MKNTDIKYAELLKSIGNGDIDRFTQRINDHPELLSLRDELGNSPFLLCAANGQLSFVEACVASLDDPSSLLQQVNNFQQNATILAASQGHAELLGYLLSLLRTSALLEQVDQYGNNTVSAAIEQNQPDALAVCLRHDANLTSAEVKDNTTPLFLAARANSLDCIAVCLEEDAKLLDQRDCNGDTLATWAAKTDNWQILRHCLQLDEELPFEQINSDGHSIIMSCAYHNSIHCLELLYEHDNDLLSSMDDRDNTLAHIAAKENQLNVLKYCSQKNPELLSQANRDDKTPGDLAVIHHKDEALKCIVEQLACQDEFKTIEKILTTALRTDFSYWRIALIPLSAILPKLIGSHSDRMALLEAMGRHSILMGHPARYLLNTALYDNRGRSLWAIGPLKVNDLIDGICTYQYGSNDALRRALLIMRYIQTPQDEIAQNFIKMNNHNRWMYAHLLMTLLSACAIGLSFYAMTLPAAITTLVALTAAPLAILVASVVLFTALTTGFSLRTLHHLKEKPFHDAVAALEQACHANHPDMKPSAGASKPRSLMINSLFRLRPEAQMALPEKALQSGIRNE